MLIKLVRTIAAPAAEIYRAFTNAALLRDWMCNAATVDAVNGGRVYLWWNDGYATSGAYTALAPNKKIAFTWQGKREKDSRVVIALTEKNGTTRVAVSHNHAQIKIMTRAWERSLENLQSLLETGQDLRLTRRPLLGINVGEYSALIAAKIGTPVTDGVRLESTVEGRGAHAAGLQKDDVIVSLGGKKVKNWGTMVRALEPHRGGDVVKVIFYRGKEKKTTVMKLSERSLPLVPMTARDLANALEKMNRALNADLAKWTNGVSDANAARKPAADEWSAQETIAHFIQTERGTHEWIAYLLSGEEPWWDTNINATNLPARIQATVQAYPTTTELRAEL